MIDDDDVVRGELVELRLVRLDDCTDRYVGWLRDPDVDRFLETRWHAQDLASIRDFVTSVRASDDSWLFAIVERASGRHVGNIKIGPVNPHHYFADVSYFIGERDAWGKGYATEAIRLVTDVGFERLGVHRAQAGVYAENVGSATALRRAGYVEEGRLRQQFRSGDGWDDQLLFGRLREDA